jgi:hypothetical protein
MQTWRKMMKINIEVTEKQMQRLILEYIQNTIPNIQVQLSDILIMVKSKQNYKAEWEKADYRATLEVHTDA